MERKVGLDLAKEALSVLRLLDPLKNLRGLGDIAPIQADEVVLDPRPGCVDTLGNVTAQLRIVSIGSGLDRVLRMPDRHQLQG